MFFDWLTKPSNTMSREDQKETVEAIAEMKVQATRYDQIQYLRENQQAIKDQLEVERSEHEITVTNNFDFDCTHIRMDKIMTNEEWGLIQLFRDVVWGFNDLSINEIQELQMRGDWFNEFVFRKPWIGIDTKTENVEVTHKLESQPVHASVNELMQDSINQLYINYNKGKYPEHVAMYEEDNEWFKNGYNMQSWQKLEDNKYNVQWELTYGRYYDKRKGNIEWLAITIKNALNAY